MDLKRLGFGKYSMYAATAITLTDYLKIKRKSYLSTITRMTDLLLLDVLMRGLNGFELHNKMRKIDENIKVCFISASNTFYEKYKRLYPEIQKECYIEKPLRIRNLASIIDKILN